jgi:hypothetical protein
LLVPRLSILIPFLGNAKLLESSLVSVLEHRPDDCEIVVVRSRAYDDPYDLQGEVCFVEASGADPVASINLGIEAARAPIVHLVACGVEVLPGWSEAALPHFDDPRVAAVAPLVLEADCPQKLVAAGTAYDRGGAIRTLGQGTTAESVGRPQTVLGPHAAAAFYRKSAVQSAGGLTADLDRLAALVHLGLLFRRAGLRTVLEPRSRLVVGRRVRTCGGAFRQALDCERLFWRWAREMGWLGSVALHGLVVTGEFCGALPYPTALARLAGRLAGFFSSSPSVEPTQIQPIAAGCRHEEAPTQPHFLSAPVRARGQHSSGAEGRKAVRHRPRKATA